MIPRIQLSLASLHKNNMRIEVITKYFYPVAAGIENNIMQTYSRMGASGHAVVIHTSADTYTERNSLAPQENINSLSVKRYPWMWWKGFIPDIQWDTVDVVALHNFNIVPHVFILLKVLWDRMRGKKRYALVVVPHGGFSPEWTVFTKVSALIKYIYQYTIGVVLINAAVDGIRAVSPWEAEEMVKRGVRPNIISTITNGLEDEAYLDVEQVASAEIRARLQPIGRYIVDVGRIYPIKNVETILYVLARLDADIQYVHVGPCQDPVYEKNLHEQVQALGLQHRVHFLGVVRGVDKYYVLKHAELMLHPALWEANANVVHEAWSQGLICVVGDTTGLRPQVIEGQTGYRVAPRDIEGFVAIINRVLGGQISADLSRMRERTRLYTQKHSWAFVSEEMVRMYTSLVQRVQAK